MEQTVASLPPSVQVLIILVLGWVAWQWFEDRKYKARRNDEALNKNTLAIVELQLQIKNLSNLLEIIPKLKSDIDAAHDKLRDYGQPKSND